MRFVVFVACLALAAAQQKKECGARADIEFVVDASGSVQASNFEITKRFLESVTKNFKIGPDDVLVGVVKYDNNPYIEFALNKHKTEAALLTAIKNIKYTSGGTATGKAINTMTAQFTPAKGDRANAINIGIVITDGNSGDAVKAAADAAKKKGITMFAIGVGPSINQNQLKDIASKPEYVLNAKNFNDLTRIKDVLSKKFCVVATKPPTTTTPKPTPPPTTVQQCGLADIMFVVDASGSVTAANFVTTKQFVANVANGFKVGPSDVQIGLIRYDQNAALEFKMNQHKNRASLLPAINNVKYTGGGTNTGKALATMLGQFTPANGDRSNAPNIGIVITDGKSSDAVKANADLAKSRGIQLFAIGVGSGVNQAQLAEIATGKDYILNVQNFNDLSKIRQKLLTTACKTIKNPATPLPTRPPTTPCVREVADIVFALDSSGSIGLDDYKELKKFVGDVSSTLNIGSSKVRIGLLRFSDKVTNSFHLNTYNTVQAVQNAIQTIPYDAGGTRTHEALTYMRTTSFTGANGARQNVPRIAIVVTDGQSAFPAATKSEADKLKAAGVTVFAIGVGAQVSQQELTGMASSPSGVISVKDFKALGNIQASISALPCQVAPPAIVDRTTTTVCPGCYDKDTKCVGYGQDVCSDYVPWAKENCACFCGFCPCQKSGVCADTITDCKDYGDVCNNPGFTLWVETNCRKYCKRC